MNLNVKAMSLAFGLLWGVSVMITVWIIILFNFPSDIVLFLGKYYLGLNVSFVGSFIGLFWGFLDGAIGGMVFAWLYNKLSVIL